jgi:hypothetical protein
MEGTMGLKTALVLFVAVGASGISVASPTGSPSPEGGNPCKKIESACESAGYSRHGKEKDLNKNCMDPILSGHVVQGVQVEMADVQACESHRRAKPSH